MKKRIADAVLLEAAVQVVSDRGFARATTREIARVAGVNEVTLFRRFGSKGELLRAAVKREFDAFFSADQARHTGDVRADLERIVAQYGGVTARFARLIPVLLAEAPNQPELQEVLALPAQVIGAIGALLLRYQEEGVLQVESGPSAVASLLGPVLVRTLMTGAYGIAAETIDPVRHVAGFLDGRTFAER